MAVRWLIVWKVCMFGMSHRDVRRELTGFNLDGEAPSLGTISTVARRYRRTGGVQTWQGQRNAAAANRRRRKAISPPAQAAHGWIKDARSGDVKLPA